jgi:2-polyprenyl-3-methyl-5-hydroxy-6-metoxy-1,4-benzoquinol methylase
MKYQAVPENLAERIALWAGMVPLPVIDSFFPLVKTRALMAAVRLGVFEALRDGPLEPAALAKALGLHGETLELLLRVVAASGYLVARGHRFALSARARASLLAGSPGDCRGYVRFNYAQWDFLENLEGLMQSGRGLDFHRTMAPGEDWENYQRGMLEIARVHAPLIAKRVPVRPGAKALLDVAGSHGLIGAALCRKHPPLRSTVIDLPAALDAARALARESRIDDVVEHRAGDLLRDPFPAADVVVLANILHHFSEAENLGILKKAREALSGDGTVAIWDIERPPAGAKPELGRDASALFFRLTSTSRCFAAEDYRKWLAEAGFTDVKTGRSVTAPLHVLIHARKPPAG